MGHFAEDCATAPPTGQFDTGSFYIEKGSIILDGFEACKGRDRGGFRGLSACQAIKRHYQRYYTHIHDLQTDYTQ